MAPAQCVQDAGARICTILDTTVSPPQTGTPCGHDGGHP
jgi:hypothetical protein